MFKNLVAAVMTALTLALFSVSALAATDINKASQAELEEVKGIGPAMSTRILDERKKSTFKNWDDVVERVKGIGPGNAAKFSSNGLTVNGEVFKASAAAPKAEKTKADRKTNKDAKATS
ncbi:MAG: ComEA family DNA-binding protein [Burkholderiales bacterium]